MIVKESCPTEIWRHWDDIMWEAEVKKLYVIGAGGFGREVAWLVERINSMEPVWELQGFLDDTPEKQGTIVGRYRVVGDCEYLERLKEETWVVCAVGAAAARKHIIEKIRQYGNHNVKFATLIDPSVLYSSSVAVGEGSIICAGTILTVDITIGKHVIVNLDCTVGHDAQIGDFVTIYPGVNVSGCAIVGQASELGTGAQIIQGKRIGKETILGAGAVVVRDLPDRCTAVGVPAKTMKHHDESEK